MKEIVDKHMLIDDFFRPVDYEPVLLLTSKE